jgi:hypothetical protein
MKNFVRKLKKRLVGILAVLMVFAVATPIDAAGPVSDPYDLYPIDSCDEAVFGFAMLNCVCGGFSDRILNNKIKLYHENPNGGTIASYGNEEGISLQSSAKRRYTIHVSDLPAGF